MAKARRKQKTEAPLKLSGLGVTESKKNRPYQLTVKFDEDTFCKLTLRHEQKHDEVAARLRKLADEIEALRS
jgi:hypothetical protein